MNGVRPGISSQRLRVGDLIVDCGTRQVLREDLELAIPKLSFQLLIALVERAPDLLSTDALAERVWAGRAVSNETITQRVKLLRDALGDDAANPTYVGVVRGEGYRLLVDVREETQSENGPIAAPRARTPARMLLGAGVVAIVVAAWLGLRGDHTESAARPAIAVLPFLNLSEDAENGYFTDGLTEEVIAELSRNPGLRVAGRTSSFAFKDRTPAFSEVGEALSVDHVLEGSVRWENDTARITAQLISAGDGYHLWSETYVHRLDGVFSVQQEIARAVADALSVQLGAEITDASRPEVNGRAYAEFLRGQALFWNHTPETTERAIAAYHRAVALDPEFERAWIGLGYAYGGRSRDPMQTATALASMAEAAQRALTIDPESWEALALRAWVEMSNHEFLQSERTMAQSLARRQSSVQLLDSINCPVACYFQQLGRVTDALAEARRVQEIDPLSPSADVTSWLYLLGRREEAIAEFEVVQQMLPRPYERRTFLRWLALESDDPAQMEMHLVDTPLAGKWGRAEELLPVLARFTEPGVELPRGMRAMFAMYATIHGDDELALILLRQEFLRPGFGAYFLLWHPALKQVRSSGNFVDLITEIGLVDAWRETDRWGDYCRPGPAGVVVCS